MQIKFFCQIARRGSISRAADDLFRTQSAVTRSMHDLEADLGVTLYERHYNGMVLTEYGKRLLPRAQNAIEDLQSVPALLSKLKERTMTVREPTEPVWLFNTRRLEIFLRLYKMNHTQTVAEQLHISQPAVSAALKVLEKGAGISFFRRTAEGVKPTVAADIIYPNISRAINELAHIRDDIATCNGLLIGNVRIGALPLSRSQILPQSITAFQARHPAITVQTNESPYDSLLAELRSGNIDFIVGALRNHQPHSDICSEVLFQEEIIITSRAGHRLLSSCQLPDDLQNAQWILPRSQTPARHMLETAFAAIGIAPPQPQVETGDAAMVRGLLLHSDMLAVVSSTQMAYELENGILAVIPVIMPNTRRSIGITLRSSGLLSPAAEALLEFIRRNTR
ncbi:LysR family transcriptional regulator [Pantoea sp. B65]